ncbi:MAG: hypothetical protein QOI55_1205, partial [Actinomycetota bacterium]|nr:hypothetical protein [Actinomycetota bacterium]
MRSGPRAATLVAISLLLLVSATVVATRHDPPAPPHLVCAGCPTGRPTSVVAGPYGHWLVDARGNVEAFGDAHIAGSLPNGIGTQSPVTGLAATPSGRGYWVVSSNGTVHAFGDAPDRGDTSALATTGSVVAIAPTPTGEGYWLATRAGAVLPFGDARAFGDDRDPGRADPV